MMPWALAAFDTATLVSNFTSNISTNDITSIAPYHPSVKETSLITAATAVTASYISPSNNSITVTSSTESLNPPTSGPPLKETVVSYAAVGPSGPPLKETVLSDATVGPSYPPLKETIVSDATVGDSSPPLKETVFSDAPVVTFYPYCVEFKYPLVVVNSLNRNRMSSAMVKRNLFLALLK
jgi:hypothetical protein